MEVRISKWSILDVFLWVDIVAQVTLCVISAFVPTDTMNLVIFYNNYVLLAFIVIALMQKGVVANYLVIAQRSKSVIIASLIKIVRCLMAIL